jgi:uncharacterized membrane protein
MAAGLGFATGMRSMTPIAMLSRELSDRRRLPRHASLLEEWLARDMVAVTLSALALGEIVADKLPGIPARVSPGPLIGRNVLGGVVGALVAGEDDRALGAVVGAAAALVGAYAGWFLRREAVRATMLPDAALAVGEDALAVAASYEIVKEL